MDDVPQRGHADEEYPLHRVRMLGWSRLPDSIREPSLGSRAPLSAVIITRNVARVLPACLESVAFADEVVVVDSRLAPTTRASWPRRAAPASIAKEWLGFGRQKQFAVEQAAHDWVLCVDSDERVSPELAASIQAALAAPASPVYRMARRNRFLGRWLAHGEGYPDWSPRLFNRRRGALERRPGAREGALRGDARHAARRPDARFVRRHRQLPRAAEPLHHARRAPGLTSTAAAPACCIWSSRRMVRFLKFYILRLGFLDGVPGLLHISIGCMNSYLKYAKLIELRETEQKQEG